MKIRIKNKEKGLYRVVVAVSGRFSGCLSTDPDDCEKRGNIRAVGFWHPHDEPDLEDKLSREANLILNAYSKMFEYSGAIIGTERKDYLR